MKINWHSDQLDRVETGTLIAGHFANERPLADNAGLVDWRLHGCLSRLLRAGRIDGSLGSTLLLPADRLPATRVILIGLGPPGALTEKQATDLAGDLANKLRGLKEERAAFAVPAALPLERAATIVAELARAAPLEELGVISTVERIELLQGRLTSEQGGNVTWQSI